MAKKKKEKKKTNEIFTFIYMLPTAFTHSLLTLFSGTASKLTVKGIITLKYLF